MVYIQFYDPSKKLNPTQQYSAPYISCYLTLAISYFRLLCKEYLQLFGTVSSINPKGGERKTVTGQTDTGTTIWRHESNTNIGGISSIPFLVKYISCIQSNLPTKKNASAKELFFILSARCVYVRFGSILIWGLFSFFSLLQSQAGDGNLVYLVR